MPPSLHLPRTACAASLPPDWIWPGGWVPAGRPVLPGPPRGDDARDPADAAAFAKLLLEPQDATARRARIGPALDAAAARRLALDLSGALRIAELAAGAAHDDAAVAAEARLETACVLLLQGAPRRAAARCRRALEGDPPPGVRGLLLLDLGVAAGLEGDLAEAGRRTGDAWEAFDAADDERGRLLAGVNRAWFLLMRGDVDAAEDVAADALRRGRRNRVEGWIARARMASAYVALARGRANDARSHLDAAARGMERAGNVLRFVQCHFLLGEIAYDAEDPTQAGSHYRRALRSAREAGMDDAVELLSLRFEHR